MQTNPENNHKTILLVDDDKKVLQLTQLVLEMLGYRVLTALDGKMGLSLYRQYQAEIILVLTDWMMPTMTGIELFKALQQQDPQVKCLLVSGNPLSAGLEKKLRAEGLQGFIQKPFSVALLLHQIDEALREPQPLPDRA